MSPSLSPGRALRSEKRAAIWLAGVLFLCFVYFLPRWYDWNQDARVDLALSIVNHRTIAIDAYHRNTMDDDFFDGHYYSNKAPGQSLLGVPAYALFKAIRVTNAGGSVLNRIERNSAWAVALSQAGARFLLRPKLDYPLLQYWLSITTVAVPALLFLLFFFRFLGLFWASLANRIIATLGLGLATPFFAYAQNYYSHVGAAALLFIAFALIFVRGRSDTGEGRWISWVASRGELASAIEGLCLGTSLLLEYSTLPIVLVLGGWALMRIPRANVFWMAVGGALPVLLLLAYDYGAYHNPLVTGYSGHSLLWKREAEGVGGFTWPPNPAALWGMTLSPYRGLFFVSPFVLLSFAGWRTLRRMDRGAFFAVAAVTVIFPVFISMYWGWFGGWSVGPRYLTPMIPFLALPVLFCLESRAVVRRVTLVLLVLSFFVTWTETIGGQQYPHTFGSPNPLFQYSLPELLHGNIALNLGSFLLSPLGVTGWFTLLPLALGLILWTGGLLFAEGVTGSSETAILVTRTT